MLENRLPIHPGLSERHFKLISTGGFGDGLNGYAHSMAWFRDQIYVSTMRANFPLMKARMPISMNPWPVECPEDPFDLDMRGEIWCYYPSDGSWKRVHKSPMITGSHGKRIPREMGCRGMIVHQNEGETRPSLYVSTWCPAKGPGPVLLRTEDGEHFEPSCAPGLIGLPVTAIRTLAQFKGRLYTSPAGSRGSNPNVSSHSIVYESRDPANGQWEPVSEFGFGDVGNKTVFELAPLGDHLYAGTLNLDGYQIWRTTAEGQPPYDWEKVLERGAHRGPLNQCAVSMYAFKGALYVGSGIQGGGIDTQNKVGPAAPELIRLYPDQHWDLLVGEERDTPVGHKRALSGYLPGFDNFFNGYFWRMCEHDGWLYLASFDWSFGLGFANRKSWPTSFANVIDSLGVRFIMDNQSGFDLYRSFDGENWIPVTTNGLGNPYNIGLRTMVSCPIGFVLGTANPFGPKVMPLGGDRYVPNPRGGCEVFLAPATKTGAR